MPFCAFGGHSGVTAEPGELSEKGLGKGEETWTIGAWKDLLHASVGTKSTAGAGTPNLSQPPTTKRLRWNESGTSTPEAPVCFARRG